jgi:ribosomal protein L32
MNDIISQMGQTVFAVVFVLGVLVFALLTAWVRKTEAKEQLKKNPIKKCPFCAETVKLEARVCKHCGRDLEPVNNQPAMEQVIQEVQAPAMDSTIEEYERWKKSQGQ